jgi:hypothetical protein
VWASANNIWLQVHAHVVVSQVNEHTHDLATLEHPIFKNGMEDKEEEMKQDMS